MPVVTRYAAEGPLDELRRLVEQADARIGALDIATPSDVLLLLRSLDRLDALFRDLEEAGVDVRAELTRRDTMEAALRRKASTLVRRLKPEGGLAAARQGKNIPQERWWWYLDAYVAQQQKHMVRQAVRGLALMVIVVGLLAVVYRLFFQPDPQVLARLNHLQRAQNAVMAQQFDEALAALDAGLKEFPNDGEMLLWRGAVLIRMKRSDEAAAAFAAARGQFDSEVTYLQSRCQVRLQAGDVDGGYTDAQELVRIDPQGAQSYLLLGSAQELRGEVAQALESFTKVTELAQASGNTQLEAMAKIRMAMLLQTAPIFIMTPTPTR